MTDDDADIGYLARRQAFLTFAPHDLGLSRADGERRPYGLLMETGYTRGTHTLACLADGTTHNDFSNGVLSERLVDDPGVRAAAQRLVAHARQFHDAAAVTASFPRPAVGAVRFYFLAAGEVREWATAEDSLTQDRDPLAGLYHVAHELLSAIYAYERRQEAARGGAVVEVAAHALNDPDPAGELAFLEEMHAESVANILKMRNNLGADFSRTLQILGYRWSLRRPAADVVAAVRSVVEYGVAHFERGRVGSDVTVTLSLQGQAVKVPGGITDYHGATRWIYAMSAAMVMRDAAAQDSLAGFNPRSFEGAYDDHFDVYARALIALVRGDAAVAGLLDEALRLAGGATIVPELGTFVAVPLVRTLQAVLAGDAAAYDARLAEGLTSYRSLYERKGFDHEVANLLPLRYLAVCALAHDRGLPCRVVSDYIPAWLVAGVRD